jgi:hypothetical protein
MAEEMKPEIGYCSVQKRVLDQSELQTHNCVERLVDVDDRVILDRYLQVGFVGYFFQGI